jgi:hypothetical protein
MGAGQDHPGLNPTRAFAADAPAATIQLRYVDASGEMQGPFPIRFDPEAALLRDQRKILDMTATSWRRSATSTACSSITRT